MRRGEVWWVDLPPPVGRRPVVLLSRNEAYQSRNLAIAAPVTTRIRNIPAEVLLGPAEGLPRRSAVNLDAIMTVPLRALQERITALSRDKLREVESAVHFALGLED